jgi:hypothetical protein
MTDPANDPDPTGQPELQKLREENAELKARVAQIERFLWAKSPAADAVASIAKAAPEGTGDLVIKRVGNFTPPNVTEAMRNSVGDDTMRAIVRDNRRS